MPVKFRGASEYTAVYKWSPSFRSASFKPTKEQSAQDAGMRSDQFYLLQEPGFTHKKSVIHRQPEAGTCLVWESSLNDFDKELKATEKALAVAQAESEKENVLEAAKVIVDEPPVKPVQVIEDVAAKTVPNPKLATKSNKKTKKNSTVAAAKQSKTELVKTSGRVKSAPAARKSTESKPPKPQAVPLRFRTSKMPSYQYPSCRSEYQLMYKKPKNVFRASPLISALDVVHKSSAIPSKSRPPFRFKTEYSVSYQKQEPLRKSMPASPASPSMKPKVKHMHTPSKKPKSPKKVQSEYDVRYPEREFPVAEQIKLVEDAEKNKVNRDGANFDPTHSVQLHSPKNKCWDMSSVSTSVPSAPEVVTVEAPESVKEAAEAPESVVEAVEVDSLNEAPAEVESVVRKLSFSDSIEAAPAAPEEENVDPQDNEGSESAKDEVTTSRTDATAVSSQKSSEVASTARTSSTVEGRIPTPDLKQMGGAQRTHHDITTPSKGGAILSSPKVKSRRLIRTEPVASSSPLKAVENLVKNEKKPPEEKKVFPELPRRMQKIVRAPIKGAMRDQEFQQYSRNSRPLSALERISVASRRSSVSVQDLLEKSLQRKDFWNQ